MISIKLDANGDFNVRWPNRDSDIITLGQNYVAYESGLPAGQRLREPDLAMVQAALAQAEAAAEVNGSGLSPPSSIVRRWLRHGLCWKRRWCA